MCGVVGLLELVEELVVVDGVLLLVVVSGPGPSEIQFIFGSGCPSHTCSSFQQKKQCYQVNDEEHLIRKWDGQVHPNQHRPGLGSPRLGTLA